jgi:hypothetical protein
MSKQAFDQVIQRASSDARFKASLSDNFEGAVRAYDLTDEETVRLAKGLGLPGAASAYAMSAAAASTNEMASNEMASNEMASNEMASNEMASNEMASNEMASNEMASNELASQSYGG